MTQPQPDIQSSSLDDRFPRDPAMLMSYVNMKLRDCYPQGPEQMADDMGFDANVLKATLAAAGFEYSPEANKFW